MTTYGFTKQKLSNLESCSPVDVSKHIISILERFNFLEVAERKEFEETLTTWMEQHKDNKPLLYAYSKLLLAFCSFYRESYDQALPLLLEARKLLTALGDPDGSAVCLVVQGAIYRTFGNFDLAIQSCLAAYGQLSKAPLFTHLFLACINNLGGIYFDMGHYEEAIVRFRSMLAIAEPQKRYYWIIYALHGLGKSYLAMKNFPEAKASFQKAMEASEIFNSPLSVCNSLSELGSYHFVAGEFGEAEAYNKRALALREQHQYLGGAITSCMRLGEIYIRESKPEEAIEILGKGLQLAGQLKVQAKMFPIHLLLSGIYEQKNDPAKSLSHYKQYNELREQVEREDTARKIKNAQLAFEAEQTKKENAVIKIQKEEIERKNIQLQETIDKLTRARIGKKARAITLVIAIALFVLEDFILHFALTVVNSNNYFISIVVKMVIIFLLSPINKAVEGYLLKKVLRKKREVLV